ncbi:MAG: sce7726 family protein [Sphingobacteriaceae bacterium]
MIVSSSDLQINTRALSRLISNAGFKRLSDKEDYKVYCKQIKKLLTKGGAPINNKTTIKDLLDFSYKYLLQEYRNEYVYKTSLLSRYILKEFSLKDTAILNEFKIGKSKADVVLVNGVNKVFEIKTELDSPERLKTQIGDYYKAFSEVYIVTHHSLLEKYLKVLNSEAGIIIYETDNCLRIARPSSPSNNFLDINVMMKCLRKQEYLNVAKNLAGYIPNVSDVQLFKSCLTLVHQFSPIEVQKQFLLAIKSRIHQDDILVTSHNIPDYLQFSCYCSKFKENQYLSLLDRLSHPA